LARRDGQQGLREHRARTRGADRRAAELPREARRGQRKSVPAEKDAALSMGADQFGRFLRQAEAKAELPSLDVRRRAALEATTTTNDNHVADAIADGVQEVVAVG
jgi:hypothetical protein